MVVVSLITVQPREPGILKVPVKGLTKLHGHGGSRPGLDRYFYKLKD